LHRFERFGRESRRGHSERVHARCEREKCGRTPVVSYDLALRASCSREECNCRRWDGCRLWASME
jgi:hypothetical protein